MPDDTSLKLTDKEVTAMFAQPADNERFPPFLSLAQAAELLQVPQNTLRDWRSRGRLKGCCRKVGKRLLFVRHRLVQRVFNEGLTSDD